MNGDSPYTSAAASAAGGPSPTRRAHQRMPVAAAKIRVPIHSRWATQSGTPRCSNTQNHGPIGQR